MANPMDFLNNFFFGGQTQLNPEYTAEQQQLADNAYSSGQDLLSQLMGSGGAVGQYKSYLDTINQGDTFANALDPTQYQGFIDYTLSDDKGALEAQAQQRAQENATGIAEQFNIGGPGSLYSGAAAKSIGEGASRPFVDAGVQYAGLQSQLMQQLMGQNVQSQLQELMTQAQGQGNAANMGMNTAFTGANMYGNQAGGYDTTATFGQTPGAFDWMNNILGVVGGIGGLGGLFPTSAGLGTSGSTPFNPQYSRPANAGYGINPFK